jgi:hypothetical protein
MKNIATLLITGSILILAGCSQQDTNKREAGKWQNKMEVESLKLTGVPPAMQAQAAQMEGQLKQQISSQTAALGTEECLSAESAAKENIGEDITKGMSGGATCKFGDGSGVKDGKLSVSGDCNKGGKNMKVAVNGNVTPKKVDATMTLTADPSGSGLALQPGLEMKLKVTQTHIGACS